MGNLKGALILERCRAMMMDANEAAKRAREYFASGMSCAEAVLRALQEGYGLPNNLLAGAMGFGGGIGRCQSVCGAISGGVIALGHLAAAQSDDAPEARVKARAMAQRFYSAFAARFEHTDCLSLTGCDFNVPGGYEAFRQRDQATGQRHCDPYVEYAVRLVVEQIEQV